MKMSLKRILMPLALAGLLVFGVGKSFAEVDAVYEIGADGLACPYCAYGLQKLIQREDGIEFIDIDFERGVVTVRVEPGIQLEEAMLQRLFRNAGFKYRGELRRVETGADDKS